VAPGGNSGVALGNPEHPVNASTSQALIQIKDLLLRIIRVCVIITSSLVVSARLILSTVQRVFGYP
jgi:hypothetical protein